MLNGRTKKPVDPIRRIGTNTIPFLVDLIATATEVSNAWAPLSVGYERLSHKGYGGTRCIYRVSR